MSRSRDIGTRWESAIVAVLRDRGWPHAERRSPQGAHDRGDIAGIPGLVIEAKHQNRITLAEWLNEATAEAANDNATLGVVWAHRKGKSSPLDGYVVMSGAAFLQLIRDAGY